MAEPFLSLDRITKFESDFMSASEPIELIVKYHGDIGQAVLPLGGTAEILSSNYAIVTLPLQNVPALYRASEVEYVELPKTLTYYLRDELNRSCITTVQQPDSFGLTGEGVLVCIIDSGIDYRHPDFRNADGTSRILYLWDQTLTGTPPPGFQKGAQFTNAQINEALTSDDPLRLVPSTDSRGHGTAVAGIAAGNGRAGGGVDRGAAPNASLAIVKLGNTGVENFTRSTEVMRGVKYVSDLAEAMNMPCVINLSYGTNNGAHDGTSLFEAYLDSMADKWKTAIVVATGNEGAAGHHFSARLRENETVTAEFITSGSISRLYLSMWKNFADTMTVELISPSGQTTGVIRSVQTITRLTLAGVRVSVLYGQPTHQTVRQEIYIMLYGQSNPVTPGVWQLVIRGVEIVDGLVEMWLPTLEDVSANTSFLKPDVELTLTIPSTAGSVISVGGYQSNLNISAPFSGRGRNVDGRSLKPDLVAPAVGIFAPAAGGGYDTFTGTSVAAPFVTGSVALMMQWGIVRGNDPFLYNQRVKAFLQRGARRNIASTVYPNAIWGYGSLSLCDSMAEVVEYTQSGGMVT
ncbi:MAG: hypothetical protein H6Q60_43 [Oscillospiraceae bacterium]|nr:hypothetical protein [Oscillospiraceae bacterium]